MSNDLFKRNCAVLAQWYAGECKEELQLDHQGDDGWLPVMSADIEKYVKLCEYRLKPRTITVNGIEVPEPVRTAPNHGDRYYIAYPANLRACRVFVQWIGAAIELEMLNAGLLHYTEDGAVRHAEAMLAPSKRAES